MKTLPELFRRQSPLGFSSDPFRDFYRMQRQMDRLMGNLALPLTSIQVPTEWVETEFTPTCDIEESESHYLMSFDLPGMKKEDVKIALRDNQLTISGERKDERREEKGKSFRTERYYGAFERSFTLPGEVKAEQVEANYADGVLRIAIPKAEAAKTHEVKIGEAKSGFWGKLTHKKEETKPQTQEKRPAERVA